MGPAPSGPMNLIFGESSDNEVSLFNRWGQVTVTLGTGLYSKWVAGGMQGTGVRQTSPRGRRSWRKRRLP